MPTRAAQTPTRRALAAALLLLAGLFGALPARAQDPAPDAAVGAPRGDPRNRDEGDPSYDGPVLPPGRERDVLALLRPFAPGGVVAQGWSIGDVSIRRAEIDVALKREGAVRAHLRLVHPSTARHAAAASAHLGLIFEPADAPSEGVRRLLIDAVRANDHASLWTMPRGSQDVMVPTTPAARRALDGAVLSLALVAFLVAAARRHTREGPRHLGAALLGVSALGLALRLWLSREAPMNAWPYSRVVPLAGAIYAGPALAWLSRALHLRVSLVDLIFRVDLALAVLTPAALFAHARAVLRDGRVALAAALLLATHPSHLRFSRSDVEFLQSLLASSLTFAALYGALGDEDRRWRRACQLALPALCLGTYLTRPENLVFFPLDLAAFAVAAAGASVPRARLAGVAALVAAPAAVAAWVSLFARYRAEVVEGLSARTLRTAAETLVSARYNTLINPSITPPWLTALAALGLVALWRGGERRKAAFLAAWLAVFFLVHSYVRPHEVAMQARYHLHLATPLLLLAASAVPWLRARAPRALWALAALTLATPWIYRGFVRDTAFYEMREFAFLRRAARAVPAGCTVIEFRGVPDPSHPSHHFDSRWQRMGNRVEDGAAGPAWTVVTADTVPRGAAARGAAEVLSPEAREVLDAPPACVMVYLGLSCVAQRPEGTREAPVCESLRTYGTLAPVAAETITGRVYDSMNIGHPADHRARVWGTLSLLPPGTPVRLGLYRYLGRERR